MKLRRPTSGRSPERRRRQRAQGLVEFALITPVVLLLLLVTIDFGRALYGWIVLQNSARVAANFAALNPDGWNPGSGLQVVKDRYQLQITQDLQAANCTSFGSGGGSGTAPQPTFIDGPDQPDPAGPIDTNYGVGDIARVTLTCTFRPITPIISAIVGNNFQLGASSEFRIRKGAVTGLPNPAAIPPPASPSSSASAPACIVVPDLVHVSGGGSETVDQARAEWAAAGFTGAFSPATGQGNKLVVSQTTTPNSNPGDCLAAATTVTVTHS